MDETPTRSAPSTAGGPPDGPPPKPKRSWLMGCLMTVLIVGCALAIAGAFWARHVGKERDRLAAHVRELQAEYEAMRPQLADEDNAAPLYLRAFGQFVSTKDYAAGTIQERLRADADMPQGNFTGPDITVLLTANRAYLQALEQAAALPGCDFHLDPSRGWALKIPYLPGFREAVYFLSIAARHEAQSGNPDRALELLGLGLRVARGPEGDGIDVGHVVHRACMGIVCGGLQKVLSESEPSPAAMEELLALVAQEQALFRRYDRIMCCAEELATLSSFLQLIDKTSIVGGCPPMEGCELSDSPRITKWDTLLWRAMMFPRDREIFEREVELRGYALAQPFPQALDQMARGLPPPASLPKWAIITRFSRDSLFAIDPNREGSYLARLELARLTLGCRLHRLKFGAYPETLAGLSAKLPEHFKELPADPFTGKPFLYRRTEAGCAVWSAGRDRADDGGDPGKDVVFQLTAAKQPQMHTNEHR